MTFVAKRRSRTKRFQQAVDELSPAAPPPGIVRLRKLWTLALVFVFAASSYADTIILKNGRRIIAEEVTEQGGQVFFDADDGRIAIPRSLVEKIEKNNAAPKPTPRPPESNSPDATFAKGLSVQITLPQRDVEGIIRDGAVDKTRLEAVAGLADKGDLECQSAVNAYLVAAAFELRHERPNAASHWAEEALQLSPQDINALIVAGQIDIVREQYTQALNHLLLAQSLRPDSPDVLTLLGYTYYFMEGPEKANRYWKQSYALRPDPKLKKLIQQTDHEEKIEGAFKQTESSHFILNWEGSQVSDAFSRQIIESLEQDYSDLEAALDYEPREPFVVILYTAQQFADITRVPNWAGALNDGKIRIPIRGLSSMTPDLARVLKHELVHSFVHRQVPGRCPTWFNEGLAQVESGETTPESELLAGVYAASHQIPLERLEGSFMNFDSGIATLAYAESRAAVAMIRDRYGAYELPAILKLLGEGKTMPQILHQLFRMSYADFETELAGFVTRRSSSALNEP